MIERSPDGRASPFLDLDGDGWRERAAWVSLSYFTRVLRLSFLAPEITRAMSQGRQPVLPEAGKQGRFSAIKLMAAGRFACVWSDQCRQLGFN